MTDTDTTTDVELSYSPYTLDNEIRAVHFTAWTATVDGISGQRGGQVYPRLMFEIIGDTPGGGTQTCCASRPPIDEQAWLRTGEIYDTDGRRYRANGTLLLPRRVFSRD